MKSCLIFYKSKEKADQNSVLDLLPQLQKVGIQAKAIDVPSTVNSVDSSIALKNQLFTTPADLIVFVDVPEVAYPFVQDKIVGQLDSKLFLLDRSIRIQEWDPFQGLEFETATEIEFRFMQNKSIEYFFDSGTLVASYSDLFQLLSKTGTEVFARPYLDPASITICVISSGDLVVAKEMLSAVQSQSVVSSEVLVCDRGSRDGLKAKLAHDFDYKYLNCENLDDAQVRNFALSFVSTQFVVFIDDLVVLDSNYVKHLTVANSHTNADAYSPSYKTDEKTTTFLGNCNELGLLKNCFGNVAVAYRTDVLRSLSGFSVVQDLDLDWDLLWRMSVAGFRIQPIHAVLLKLKANPKKYDEDVRIKNIIREMGGSGRVWIHQAYKKGLMELRGHS